MSAIVIAETEKGARGLCAGARSLADDVALVSLGSVTAVSGIADVVFCVSIPAGKLVESAAATVSDIVAARAPEVVLVEPTRRMKVIAGKIAAMLGVSAIAGATDIEGASASALYFGGLAVRRYQSAGAPAVFIAAPSQFDGLPAVGTDIVEDVAYIADGDAVALRSRETLPPAKVDLTAAKNIVAAGRGFAEEADLQLARDLAGKIEAEVGCTRPLTEAVDWMPRETYIGVSGLTLKPDVYVGVGVSGQMQHMVGVSGAKAVFSINKDRNAPIFRQSDYGLVGDLKAVLPEVIARL